MRKTLFATVLISIAGLVLFAIIAAYSHWREYNDPPITHIHDGGVPAWERGANRQRCYETGGQFVCELQ